MYSLTALWINNWRLFRLYFMSEERFYARSRLLILFVLQLINIGLGVVLTYWNREFINAFQLYDRAAFLRLLLYFCFLATAIISISSYKSYLAETYQLQWRRWMTDYFIKKYLSSNAFYTLLISRNSGETTHDHTDNPDQRIAEDINSYVASIYSLLTGVVNSFATLISYVIILWSLSDVIKIHVTQHWSLSIHGSMLWAALVYAIIGTVISNRIGRALINLRYTQEQYQANFRYGLIRVRDHAESVALYRSESNEYTLLSLLYDDVYINFRKIICRNLGFNCFFSFYDNVAIVFPYVVASARYFSRAITLGDLSQIATAFNNVYSSLSFIPNSYGTIVQWRSSTKRLIEFDNILNKLNQDKQESRIKILHVPEQECVQIQNLIVRLPSKIGQNQQQILINEVNLVLQAHQAVLITGNSGCGKSTFLRTLAGIWPYGSGTIRFRLNDTMAFLPQKPYCPLGSLRHCLTYPSKLSSSLEHDTNIKGLLQLCQMEFWCDRLDEIHDWSRVLSLGEQQMMAFIRILIHKPKWLFLDEATSSLDEQTETYLYSILFQVLENHTTIVSIGHRNNLRQFHQIELVIDKRHIQVKPLSVDK